LYLAKIRKAFTTLKIDGGPGLGVGEQGEQNRCPKNEDME